MTISLRKLEDQRINGTHSHQHTDPMTEIPAALEMVQPWKYMSGRRGLCGNLNRQDIHPQQIS